jgi:predicted O-linked N-acetylglucosamine transferase (SPINDLY family)
VNIPEALKTALALHTSGRLAEAEELYRRILAAEPEQAEAALHLARVVHQAGRPAEAAALYRAALANTPDSFEILADLSRALREAGDPAGAAEVLRRASQLAPEDAGPFVALGQILLELGRGREALAACRQALMRDPTGSAANLCTGQALLALGEPQRATAHFRRIIETAPDASEAHNALGAALAALGDLDGAAAAFTRATELAPGGAEAYANLAGVLREAGQTEAASLAYDRAVDLGGGPGAMVKRALLLPVLPESVPEIDRARRRMADRLDRLRSGRVRLADPYREVGQTPCALACHGRDDRPLQESWAFFYRRACPELSFVADHCREPEAPKGRIRLGIVSAFLHDHTIGRLNRGFIERLDRSRFKLVVCRLPGRMDEYAAAAEAAADELVDLPDAFYPARDLLAAKRLDVIYYPDGGLHALTYFLLHARLAPVQCVGWGHPQTTGLATADLFLSGTDMEPEGADAHYTERLVRLSRLNLCVPRPPEAPELSRADFGLPEDRTLYLCPQSLSKFHPDFDRALGSILRTDPKALVVAFHGAHPRLAGLLAARLAHIYPREAERIAFLPRLSREQRLGLTALVDVNLDTFHFGSVSSSLDAFGLGRAVVTLPGDFARGRTTSALYRRMGMEALIAGNWEEYVALALRLGREIDFREEMEAEIAARSELLFDDTAAVEECADVLAAAAGVQD